MVNAQCKKARNSYDKNIADVQQSNPKQWWSAVKKMAGLFTPKMPKTLIYNDCTYQGEDLANLFNDLSHMCHESGLLIGSQQVSFFRTNLLFRTYPLFSLSTKPAF